MSSDSRLTRALSKWTFPVTGVLAVLGMLAVFAIAGRDQLLGVERWCYRHGRDGDRPGGTLECRDDERTCAESRRSVCRQRRASWVGPCRRAEDASAPAAEPVERCDELP